MVTKGSDRLVQQPLWVEDWRDGVRAIGYGIGGMKALALSLWPAKREKAENWLSDCLNADRSAKLAPEEFLQIISIGREHGIHVLMHHIADQTHYTRPNPVEPEDQRADLQRQFLESVRTLDEIRKRLEKV